MLRDEKAKMSLSSPSARVYNQSMVVTPLLPLLSMYCIYDIITYLKAFHPEE